MPVRLLSLIDSTHTHTHKQTRERNDDQVDDGAGKRGVRRKEGRKEKKKSRPSCSILPWFRHCGLEEALGKHHFE